MGGASGLVMGVMGGIRERRVEGNNRERRRQDYLDINVQLLRRSSCKSGCKGPSG